MSIIRIIEGENITNIEGSWTVFTDEFEAYAGQFSHSTAVEGTNFGNPEIDKQDNLRYFKDGWWSADKEGTKRITDANVGQTVYFQVEMHEITEEKKIILTLYDYDGDDFLHEQIGIYLTNSDGSKRAEIDTLTLEGKKASLPLTLSPGIERAAENDENDEVQLYFYCTYEKDILVKLPKSVDKYLNVHTCDKKVVKSYKGIGYGKCEFYQFRYNDFMRRHKDCGHVPPLPRIPMPITQKRCQNYLL